MKTMLERRGLTPEEADIAIQAVVETDEEPYAAEGQIVLMDHHFRYVMREGHRYISRHDFDRILALQPQGGPFP